MKENEIKDLFLIVNKINNEWYDLTNDDTHIPLAIMSDGYNCVVSLFDFLIWSSEDDERIYLKNEIKEDLENFIRKKIIRFVSLIKKFKIKEIK